MLEVRKATEQEKAVVKQSRDRHSVIKELKASIIASGEQSTTFESVEGIYYNGLNKLCKAENYKLTILERSTNRKYKILKGRIDIL